MKQFTGTMSHFANKQDYFEAKAKFYEEQVKTIVTAFEGIRPHVEGDNGFEERDELFAYDEFVSIVKELGLLGE